MRRASLHAADGHRWFLPLYSVQEAVAVVNTEVQMAVARCCAPSMSCARLGGPEIGNEGPPCSPKSHAVHEFCSLFLDGILCGVAAVVQGGAFMQ